MVASSPLFHGLPIAVLMSGKGGKDEAKQLEWAQGKLQAAGLDATPLLIPGTPGEVVIQTIAAQHIDLLIMGAYAHSPLRSLLFGCKTNDLLRTVNIPVLLLR